MRREAHLLSQIWHQTGEESLNRARAKSLKAVRAAIVAHKNRDATVRAIISAQEKVFFNCRPSTLIEVDGALFTSLAHDPGALILRIQVAPIQRDELADAHAGSPQGFQQRGVA